MFTLRSIFSIIVFTPLAVLQTIVLVACNTTRGSPDLTPARVAQVTVSQPPTAISVTAQPVPPPPSEDEYDVTVQCDPQAALTAAKFDIVQDEITPASLVQSERSPTDCGPEACEWIRLIEKHRPTPFCQEGERIRIRLFHFDQDLILNEEATKRIYKAGYRFATWPEFLALAANYPDLQRSFDIREFSTFMNDQSGNECTVALFERKGRAFWLSCFGNAVNNKKRTMRYAAVRR